MKSVFKFERNTDIVRRRHKGESYKKIAESYPEVTHHTIIRSAENTRLKFLKEWKKGDSIETLADRYKFEPLMMSEIIEQEEKNVARRAAESDRRDAEMQAELDWCEQNEADDQELDQKEMYLRFRNGESLDDIASALRYSRKDTIEMVTAEFNKRDGQLLGTVH